MKEEKTFPKKIDAIFQKKDKTAMTVFEKVDKFKNLSQLNEQLLEHGKNDFCHEINQALPQNENEERDYDNVLSIASKQLKNSMKKEETDDDDNLKDLKIVQTKSCDTYYLTNIDKVNL